MAERTGCSLSPWWFRLPSFTLLALGLANLGKAWMAVRYARLLPDLPMTVSWTYLEVSGAVWGVVLTACGVGLSTRRAWARYAAPAAATGYAVHFWLDRLLFDVSEYALQHRPWDLLLTFLLLLFVWAGLGIEIVRSAREKRTERTGSQEGG